MGFVREGGLDVLGLGGSATAQAAREGVQLQAESGREAIAEERAAREAAQQFFEPFAGVAERGIEEGGFLADPQAQFDFLQQNPLFDLALENANRVTQQSAASQGRLSAGDTLTALSNNVLLSAQPLIDRQRQDIGALLNLGTGITTAQANTAIGQGTNVGNLLTDIGSAQAAGGIGAANAQTQGNQNLASIGMGIAAMFSDERLKSDIKESGEYKGHKWYRWRWNGIANTLGLNGASEGVLAQDVIKTNPDAVTSDASGY
jgi:hypothetical protein